MYFSNITIDMLYMSITFVNYIMFIIVTVVSRDIVSYVSCMLYFLCEIVIIIQMNKCIYFRYIDARVCGIMYCGIMYCA